MADKKKNTKTKNDDAGEKETGKGQCLIKISHLNEIGKSDRLNSLARLRGVLKTEIDSANRAIVVDYDPSRITFQDLREWIHQKAGRTTRRRS